MTTHIAKRSVCKESDGWKSKASGNTISIPVQEVLRTIFKVITVAVNHLALPF